MGSKFFSYVLMMLCQIKHSDHTHGNTEELDIADTIWILGRIDFMLNRINTSTIVRNGDDDRTLDFKQQHVSQRRRPMTFSKIFYRINFCGEITTKNIKIVLYFLIGETSSMTFIFFR